MKTRHDPPAAQAADDIIGLLILCLQLLPMMHNLIAIEAALERVIRVMTGQSYADRAQEYLMGKYLPDNGDAP